LFAIEDDIVLGYHLVVKTGGKKVLLPAAGGQEQQQAEGDRSAKHIFQNTRGK
jgi:CO dehydrogenase/acetyl-CoA synthase gamma subunit (corrinoid Fe-S protein)